MTAPTPAYLTELAERVRTGSGISNRLDIEIELALFDPKVGSFVSVQPNASRTKLVYRRADGTDVTARAHDWTMRREHSAAQLRFRAVELMKALAPAPANPTALEAAIANLEAFDRDGTILSEVENEVAFTENVALCLHELKRLRADQMRQPQYLSPDATDIRLIRDGVLPRCPCCDGTPTTFTRYFAYSGIYQSFVHCSRCDVQVFKNANDHEGARNLAIAAWSCRPADAKCTASPDRADILETIQNASDDWQAMGYPTALAEVRDMANVGRALLKALPEGYHYNNCPSEIVSDLQNERDERPARRFLKLVNRIADWTDAEVAAACPAQVRHVARVVRDGADPTYPPFAAPKSGEVA